MSKKMLKRSLALGALMAFVITGSAMAAEVTVNNSLTSFVPQNNDTVLTMGGDLSNLSSTTNPIWIKDATINSWDKVIYNGSNFKGAVGASGSVEYFETVFYASSGKNLTINEIGTIETNIDSTENDYSLFFSTQGGSISVNAEVINVNGVGQAVRTNVDGQTNESRIAITAKDITLSGKNGVYAWDKTYGNGAESRIDITATNKLDIIGKTYGVLSCADGSVNLNAKNIYIEGKYAIYGYGGDVNVTTIGKTDVLGEVWAYNSIVDIELGNGGQLKGQVYAYDGAEINIDLGNGSVLDVTDTTYDNMVTTLSGAGTVVVGNDDKVVVKNNEASLTVQAAGVTADDFDSEEKQQAQLNDLAGKVVNESGKELAKTFAIAEGAVVGAVTAEVTADGKAGKAVEAVNTVNQSIGEAAVNLKAHYRAHMNDMNKRMGELRMANGETGVWTRMVRGENEYEGAKSQYNQYQLGYDEKLSVDKRWTVGAAVTFAEGSGNFANGSTEDDSTAFAIYGSKLNNDGTFVDLIARYARLESDITMGRESADYSTNGYSVSAEFGKRIQQGKGLWIEPQVELMYGNVDSAEYTIAGRNVQVGDMDSLIGRVGFRLGKDIKEGNVYARASYLYDFDGETETTFSNAYGLTRTIEEDFGGGWWEVGVGANINLSKATYIYADIEKTFGGEVDTNWQWNLGVRYSF